MSSNSERDARINIDNLLIAAGWDPAERGQVRREQAAGTPSAGRADYVLLAEDGSPLAVVEAKREGIHPYTAKQQALPYARQLGAPFVFLTNGDLIYFWDYERDDARPVSGFYARKDLQRLVALRRLQQPLATIPVPADYFRQGEPRRLRPYQLEAIRALDAALELGKRRFLLRLPTGTGKTDLTVLYLKRLFEAGRAERVLVLVDREQLANQALEAVQDLLGDHSSYWLRPGAEQQEKQVTVALLQTMISRVHEFSAGHFDVVVQDEAHRSIYGAWQAALTRFDALHVGLTATPVEYIERNTYEFYECANGQPDYSLTMVEAVRDGFLAPYRFASGITELISSGVDVDDEHYDPAVFERTWTNEATNRLIMEEFDRLAWSNYSELAPGLAEGPGKGVVFAISKHHASRLASYLNDLHPEAHGRYAEVITSDVANVDGVIRRFKREDYPKIAVSVGMLDTGFDCREILHVVLARRVLSPILYQQMRGRGARTAPHIRKRGFIIYDFFGNRQRFEDRDLTAGGYTNSQAAAGSTAPSDRRLLELGLADEWLEAVNYVEVGPDGERIDKREYLSRWAETVRRHQDDVVELQKVRDGAPLTEAEEESLTVRLNAPDNYFNEQNLRRAYRRPGGDIVDFVRAALGTDPMRTRSEELEDVFRAWLVLQDITPEQAEYLALLRNRGIAKGRVTLDDLLQPPLSFTGAASRGVELFGNAGLVSILRDLNLRVFAYDAEVAEAEESA